MYVFVDLDNDLINLLPFKKKEEKTCNIVLFWHIDMLSSKKFT